MAMITCDKHGAMNVTHSCEHLSDAVNKNLLQEIESIDLSLFYNSEKASDVHICRQCFSELKLSESVRRYELGKSNGESIFKKAASPVCEKCYEELIGR